MNHAACQAAVLEGEQPAELVEHLAGCSDCRAFEAAHRSALALRGQALPAARVAPVRVARRLTLVLLAAAAGAGAWAARSVDALEARRAAPSVEQRALVLRGAPPVEGALAEEQRAEASQASALPAAGGPSAPQRARAVPLDDSAQLAALTEQVQGYTRARLSAEDVQLAWFSRSMASALAPELLHPLVVPPGAQP